MKHLPILILSIFAFATAAAHQPVAESATEPATLRHGYRTYEKHALRGKVKQVIDYFACDTLASGQIVPDTATRHYLISYFNRAGNVVKEEYHLTSRDSRRQDGSVQYIYNEQDSCVEESRHSGELLRRVYDAQGRLIEIYETDRDGNKEYHSAYRYDKRGRKIAAYPVDPKSNYIYERYKYDAAGNCVKKSRYNDSGKLLETSKMRYDRQGRVVKFRKQARGREYRVGYLRRSKAVIFDYTPHERTEYRYDERGNCVEKISYFPVNKVRARRVRQFDAMDNCIDDRFYQERGDSIHRKSHTKTEYEYDAQGNWIRKAHYLVHNGESRLGMISLREITYYE